MFVVYAIHNERHGKTYIGQTDNLTVRLRLHNEHEFISSYTSRFDGAWVLIYSETLPTRKEALKREKSLKSFRGREFIKQFIPR